jgi:hypothetical protein
MSLIDSDPIQVLGAAEQRLAVQAERSAQIDVEAPPQLFDAPHGERELQRAADEQRQRLGAAHEQETVEVEARAEQPVRGLAGVFPWEAFAVVLLAVAEGIAVFEPVQLLLNLPDDGWNILRAGAIVGVLVIAATGFAHASAHLFVHSRVAPTRHARAVARRWAAALVLPLVAVATLAVTGRVASAVREMQGATATTLDRADTMFYVAFQAIFIALALGLAVSLAVRIQNSRTARHRVQQQAKAALPALHVARQANLEGIIVTAWNLYRQHLLDALPPGDEARLGWLQRWDGESATTRTDGGSDDEPPEGPDDQPDDPPDDGPRRGSAGGPQNGSDPSGGGELDGDLIARILGEVA